jgi:hypothetical protein
MVLHEEVALAKEWGRAPRAGRFCVLGDEGRQVGPQRLRAGLLEQLSPTPSVAHRKEGAGGGAQSDGGVVLVRADDSYLKLDLRSRHADEMTRLKAIIQCERSF